MVRKLIFMSGTVILTYSLCFWSSQHDLPKNLIIVIYPGFLDDKHSILDNSCRCPNELILRLHGSFIDQKHDFLINEHVLIVTGCWKLGLNH
jgi:hypothetical protein